MHKFDTIMRLWKTSARFLFRQTFFSFLLLMRLPRGLESLNHLIFCADGRRGCFLYYPIQFYDMVRHKSPEKWEHVTSSFNEAFYCLFKNRSSFITSNFKINGFRADLCGPFMWGLLRHLDKTISSLIYGLYWKHYIEDVRLLDQYLRGYFLSCG